MNTDEQIKARASAIGNRPYHPVIFDGFNAWKDDEGKIVNSGYCHGYSGITIRGELLKTAMGNLCSNPACIYRPQQDNGINYASESISVIAKDITNALLIQMAKDELGVEE